MSERPNTAAPDAPPTGSAPAANDGATDAATAAVPPPAEAPEQEKLNAVIQIEEIGPCRKKISIEIPKETVEKRLKKTFDEFRRDNVVPGFRRGHAPRGLIEKRVGSDLREQLKGQLIMEAMQDAEELKKLRTVGEPALKAEDVKLVDNEALKFSFETEVRPEFTLPEYKGLKLHRHKYEIGDRQIDAAVEGLRRRHGAFEPVEGGVVQPEDRITADVHIQCGDVQLAKDEEQTIPVMPANMNGLPIEDLPEKLAGAEAGEVREFTVKVPDGHPVEAVRGKDASVKITVKGVKRIVPVEIDELLKRLEAGSVDELRAGVLDELERSAERARDREVRDQVLAFLLKETKLELPPELAVRYAAEITRRSAMRMMMEGAAAEAVRTHAKEIQEASVREAVVDLALSFILEDIAEKESIQVSREELNGAVAALAAQHDRRFDRMLDELSRDGRLESLYSNLRDRKVVDRIIEQATVEDLDHEAGPGHTHEHDHGHSHEHGHEHGHEHK
jgi:trigger factor